MFCEHCGNKLPDGARFCTACGQAVAGPKPAAGVAPVAGPESVPVSPPETVARSATEIPPAAVSGPVPVSPPAQGYSRPPTPAYGPAPQTAPVTGNKKKPKVALIVIIVSVSLVLLAVAAYFLYFRGAIREAKKLQADQTATASLTDGTASARPTKTARTKATKESSTTQEKTTDPTTTVFTEPPLEVVNDQLIRINSSFDSGEGFYSGEIRDGLPHGQGSFYMLDSDSGADWFHEGAWVNGEMTGEGYRIFDNYEYRGNFRNGLPDGHVQIIVNGETRYIGNCVQGQLQGQGQLFAPGDLLIYEGDFERNMLVETAAERRKRGQAFAAGCVVMDDDLYIDCLALDDVIGTAVEVWGYPLGMSDQEDTGTVVLAHFGDEWYPVCLVYRYGVNEQKIESGNWLDGWGVVTGLFEYIDAYGDESICPEIELVYWSDEP